MERAILTLLGKLRAWLVTLRSLLISWDWGRNFILLDFRWAEKLAGLASSIFLTGMYLIRYLSCARFVFYIIAVKPQIFVLFQSKVVDYNGEQIGGCYFASTRDQLLVAWNSFERFPTGLSLSACARSMGCSRGAPYAMACVLVEHPKIVP